MNHIFSVYLLWELARSGYETDSVHGIYIREALALERQAELRNKNPFHDYEIKEQSIDDHNNALFYDACKQ